MLRTRYLPAGLLALTLVLAACSSEESTSPSASSSVIASPSSAATETPSATGSEAASEAPPSDATLTDLVPDDLNGAAPTITPASANPMLAQAFAAAGIDASDFEHVIATYGTGPDAATLSAMRVTGVDQSMLRDLAGQMAGSTEAGELEETTVAGKSVLRVTGSSTQGTAYIYFADGAVFTVIGASEDMVTQLLAQLP